MEAGTHLRKLLARADAMAMLGVLAIQESRQGSGQTVPRPRANFAHIIHSLKRPEEVRTLRRIYGPALVVLGAYSPRPTRLKSLAREIADSRASNQSGDFLTRAEQLLRKDEQELGQEYGQNVADTFPLADIVIETSSRSAMLESVQRAIDLFFGNIFETPNRDEQGMYLADGAAFRSASLARQVGAAICRTDGSLVALGTNEVPKSGGGAYWCNDGNDHRDFRLGYDSSGRMRENVLTEILGKLQSGGWLSDSRKSQPIKQLVVEAVRTGQLPSASPPILKSAQFLGTIDYVRAVHAEMAAITDAARHGISTNGCILYTTTFPCHDCAKHIIAAGISRVVYVKPYR